MTLGSFDETQLGKLDEVEWTMLTPSPLSCGIWENMVVFGAQLSRQPTELGRSQLAVFSFRCLLSRSESLGSAIQFTKWHQMGPERNVFESFLV